MDKIQAINPQRILWCCEEQGLSLEQLSREVGIALATLESAMQGEDVLSINQLRKIASQFNRGMLFFLEHGPVNEAKVHSAQFRTITNQKPELSPKLTAFVERIERQRQVYISLLEDLGEEVETAWYPIDFKLDPRNVKQAAYAVRRWLGLVDGMELSELRRAVESKGILVFISNGYKGQWQIAKENPIRGFSLYYPSFPTITIKKQKTEGPQAFTMMHELAHLLLHKDSFIDDEDDFFSYQGKEKAANEFAGNVLVPDEQLGQLDLNNFPGKDVVAYDSYLQSYCRRWCVSTEVILRRMLNEGLLLRESYQAYRQWKQSLPPPKETGGGSRYRYKEPIRIFGEPFVHTVLNALHGKQITLARASTYLDNLKIKDLRRLEETHVHI
ncbi:helix-turn-helix domain-containing protein [endosymbiont of Lamellibrachia barhami]|uniref:helix-turn-helix domain-containing protein n=1 Tax=endosymbiont of Lamellibrachia barhami TaxID=205975 RepID=UPI0015AF06C9|nr:XRE family transcriptional regulator [endosymbiont of Lamellibrachia barhami]